MFDPSNHIFNVSYLASQIVNLRPASNAGLDAVAPNVTLNLFAKKLVMLNRMGPGAHQAHAAL